MNVLAFTFFVFLSSIFWFTLNINKRYIETISFPVKYDNFPPRRVQTGYLPDKIQITIEAGGFSILQYKIWSAIDPLNINIAECTIFPVSRKDSTKFYILTNLERKQISSQLTSEMRVMDIKPDTIMFQFDFVKIKKVPVKGKIEINCANQYMLVGKPHFEPDSIVISGPSSVLDTLFSIHTNDIVLNEVKNPIDKSISFEKIKGTDAEKRKLKLIADVDKYTETKLELPVIPINVPDTLELKTFPKTVLITYHVPFKIFDDINPDDFLFTVDYNKIDLNTSDKLKLILEKAPENINIIGWQPKDVEFIVEK